MNNYKNMFLVSKLPDGDGKPMGIPDTSDDDDDDDDNGNGDKKL